MATQVEAAKRLLAAMKLVERAQVELSEAQSLLASITGVIPRWQRVGKLYDMVRGEWYKLNDVYQGGKVDLDELSKEAFTKAGRIGG